ncbi:MAG: hypothetical protein ACR2LV_06425 [Solirubrobacteraceae bacterium]
MIFPPAHLVENPLPRGIVAALELGGYQLLTEIAGVGAGRLGAQAFLLVAADPEPAFPDVGTQIALHHQHCKDESELAGFTGLAAQLGYLRLTGYRIALERAGLRSKIRIVDPATGALLVTIPARHPGKLLRGRGNAAALLAATRALPPAGPPPSAQNRELTRQVLIALALGDETLGGAQAVELADRALELTAGHSGLDPRAALDAAKRGER